MRITKYFFQNIPKTAQKGFKRFYLPITLSILATLFFIFLIYYEKIGSERFYHIENMIMVLFAGIPLISFIFLLTEKFNFSQNKKCLANLSTLAVIIIYYFTLPKTFQTIDLVRYAVLSFFSTLTFLSFPVFISRKREITRKIWLFIFTKTTFANIAALSLFAGLSLAVMAIKTLFFPAWNESDRLITSFFAISFGLVAPWIILGSFPDIKSISQMEIVEKPFILISKFILIPTTIFYLIILYIYFGKIMFVVGLPEGTTVYLILSFCGIGIMTYILLLKEAEKSPKSISGIFIKFFFFSIIGLILLLWYAVWIRVDSYGITENRYLLILFSLFLTGWTLYFLISKRKNIVIITITGAVVALFITFGPWSMFETSFRSQKSRLIEIFEENNLIENGKIKKSINEIPFKKRKDITSAMFYIEKRWGLERLSELFPDNKPFKKFSTPSYEYYSYTSKDNDTAKVLKWMNIDFVNKWTKKEEKKNLRLNRKNKNSYTVEGPFDAVIKISCPLYDDDKQGKTEKETYRAELSKECENLSIYFENNKKYEIDMIKVAQKLQDNNKKDLDNLSMKAMTYKETSESVNVTIVFDNISGNLKENKIDKITYINGEIFLSVKK